MFTKEEERKLFFIAVSAINKLVGMIEESDDFCKEQRTRFTVIRGGGEKRNIYNNKQNVCECEQLEQNKRISGGNDNNNSSFEKGDEELKKNIRQRSDGRWEFRKVIDGERISIIRSKQCVLLEEIKILKEKLKPIKVENIKESFYETCKKWVELYKNGIKSKSRYIGVVDIYFKKMTMSTTSLKKDKLQEFLNNISGHRNRAYASYIVKGVFQNEFEQHKIKYNIANNLIIQNNQTKKGINFTLDEQKLILENLHKTPIKNEILFYLLTGCRLSEAFDIKINFERNIIFINGTKTKASQRYVPISFAYTNILKENHKQMFKRKRDYYTKNFKRYLDLLGIKEKTLHDMRHTFSTNMYYLGATDKERQAFLGHSSIVMTNDIYTHLDPTITKQHILDLYKELYPKF